MHVSETDLHGGVALVRSFVAQLLHRFDTTCLERIVDLAGVQRGELAGICHLFGWLVCQLPRDTTVICILNDLGIYERELFVQQTSAVMGFLVQMMQDMSVAATVKMLATSMINVRKLRQFFPQDGVVDLSTISDADGPNRLRM